MTKLKRKNAYIVFAIIGVLAIIGISFASAFTIGKSSEINVYPVSVDANIDLVEDLSDVVQGDTVVNGISFSRLDSSKDIFVRANLNYYKQSNITDDDKRFLLSINYEDIPTFVGTDYKWTRSGDGYYYLTDLQGVPLKVTSSTTYTFCEEITYTGATSIRNEIPYISELRLEANIQAINAREVSSITLSNISELFSNAFASSNMYGYIVTFDTDGAGDISAQTFLSDNQKVVQPTQPNKIGYDFVGWYADPEFNNLYDFNSVVSTSFTLYAKYKYNQKHTITFISEGNIYQTIIVENGDHITAPVNPTSNETDMRFVAWYTDSACTAGNEYNFDTVVSSNFTLYAKFEIVPIQIIEDGVVIKEIVNNNYTLSQLILSDAELQNRYNFYRDDTLTENILLTDALANGQKIYVESVTSGLKYSKLSNVEEYRVGDGTTTAGNAYPSVTDTDVVVADNYTFNDLVYPVTEIGQYSFSSKTTLTNVKIPNIVTNIGNYAFSSCRNLTGALTIPNGVTTIGDRAFVSSGITGNLTIPDSVTNIGNYAFSFCRNLTGTLTISNRITSIGDGVFNNCSGLIGDLTIPNNVTSIGEQAFAQCGKLTGDLNIPEGVESIGLLAFSYCDGLTSITIPDSVISIGNFAFSGCGGLTSIKVSEQNTIYDSRNNCNAIIEKSTKTLIRGCQNTIIPNNITCIGTEAFSYCDGLTSINIPNNITSLSHGSFWGCGFKEITIPSSITSISDYAFYGCDKLEEVIIPNSITIIGEKAFSDCSVLNGVTIPDTVTSIGDEAFRYCDALTSVTIGEGVSTIGDGAFSDCSGLTEINYNAINCDDLSSSGFSYPVYGGVDTILNIGINVVKIPAYLFSNSHVKSVSFKGTKCTSIGDYAFSNTYSLSSITIPSSITKIGMYAFYKSQLISATFEVTTGWYVSTSSTATSGITLALTNSSTNATYLKTTYDDYYWFRS